MSLSDFEFLEETLKQLENGENLSEEELRDVLIALIKKYIVDFPSHLD